MSLDWFSADLLFHQPPGSAKITFRLMLQKWTIVLSQFCSNVMGGCLSSGVKMTANYVAYAVKLNKWPLLSQVVTVFISAICLSFQLDVQCYYDYYWYHEYEECDLLLRLIPPRRTFAVGGVSSSIYTHHNSFHWAEKRAKGWLEFLSFFLQQINQMRILLGLFWNPVWFLN